MRLHVKVIPKATRPGIAGWLGDALKIRVSAAPEHGKANGAVCTLLAKQLQVPLNAVRIVSGHSNPHKVVEIDGMDEKTLRERLS
jgi:uncharacterized protein (TIGR00251 family)